MIDILGVRSAMCAASQLSGRGSFLHYSITDDHVVYIQEGYHDCSLPSQNLL